MHHARQVFGNLKKIEIQTIEEATEDDPIRCKDNLDFYELHTKKGGEFTGVFHEMELKKEITPKKEEGLIKNENLDKIGLPKGKYAFSACLNKHIVGIVISGKHYFTDVSEIDVMFPGGHLY